MPQRVRWWKSKLEGKTAALVRTQSPLALLPVQGLRTARPAASTRLHSLADVIPRVQDHPKRRLDELLPGPWSRTRAEA